MCIRDRTKGETTKNDLVKLKSALKEAADKALVERCNVRNEDWFDEYFEEAAKAKK